MKRIAILLVLSIVSIIARTEPIKVAFLTDLHVVPGNASDCTLRDVIEEINTSNFNFVIISGDISNQGSDVELRNMKSILSALKIPYYMISGNHETTWSESGCQTYSKLFGDDRFAFASGNYFFIGVPCGPYMKMGDGFIKYEDILWAQKTLKKKLKPGMKLISFNHYPLDKDLSDYRMYLDVLKQYNAAVNFCGHGHKLHKYDYEGIPGFMGRALMLKGDKDKGYNIIKIDSDSLYLYEKRLNEPESRYGQISINGKPLANSATTTESYGNTDHLQSVYQDKASIFNNVGTFDKGIIFGNSLGTLTCYNSEKNAVAWTRELRSSVYARPIVVNSTVIVGTIDGKVLGLNLKNGKTKWSVKGEGIFVGAPRVENQYVYIAGSKEFMKIDTQNGNVAWRAKLPSFYSQGLPALNGSLAMFGAWDTNLYALDKSTGNLAWKWNNGRSANLLSPGNVQVAATDSLTFLVAPDRFMTCLSSTTGKTLWRNNDYKVRESMGFSADSSLIYAKTMDGWLLAIQPTSAGFNVSWKVDLGIGYEHNPCPIVEYNGVVLLGSRKGEVVAVDAKSHQVLWNEKVGLSSVNGFAIDGLENVWTSLIEGKVLKIKSLR